ncbi:uncharacterized protein SCHCODRAFT_02313703 [Schizophyllum commune H4-8]|uniref:uncharacterized protein n=1 Tax=Schizophyllum commune (strain H4-8 / FGSC 9210) TaxID=578458 RepID=UPI002160E7FA|nr:uncharacterized protein SCHCODRAFT_02313703 [Schizophyllum commune H4-8]KAI5891243.1 hypothetical protein SCHCODRAFT_02313703 [Schizophyllum commune H4-8]
MNVAASRTRKGSHRAPHPRIWVIVASAPSARSWAAADFQAISTPLAPPRDEKGPGLQHASYPGRPTKQTVSLPRKRLRIVSSTTRNVPNRTAEGWNLGCGLHHLVAGRRALRNREPERPVGPSSTYR